jgi:hypothetical protein
MYMVCLCHCCCSYLIIVVNFCISDSDSWCRSYTQSLWHERCDPFTNTMCFSVSFFDLLTSSRGIFENLCLEFRIPTILLSLLHGFYCLLYFIYLVHTVCFRLLLLEVTDVLWMLSRNLAATCAHFVANVFSKVRSIFWKFWHVESRAKSPSFPLNV